MPNYMEELHESQSIILTKDGIKTTRIYEFDDTRDPEVILNNGLVPAYGAPHPTLANTFVNEVRLEPFENRTRLVVSYGPSERNLENSHGEIWEWNFTATQVHITSVDSPAKQIHYPPTFDCGPAIGLDGDEVHGVDVYRPAATIRVAKRLSTMPSQQVISGYFDRQGKVNNGAFAGWQARELLFNGIQIEPLPYKEARLTFNFLAAKRKPEHVIYLATGEPVAVASLDPWDYFWYRHIEKILNVPADPAIPGDTGKAIKQNHIESIHLAKVYDDIDFTYFNLHPFEP